MSGPLYKVLICGGGFGGIKIALELESDERFQVTLISDRKYMNIYPSLYHTATGGSKRVSSIALQEIFESKKVNVVYDSVKKLDRENRTITTKGREKFKYNALVLALGVHTNYFGIEGLEEYSYGIKSLEEAQELKTHLHKQLVKDGRQDINYVVVGGGPSGVELASVLPSYIAKISAWHDLPERKVHVDLIEAAPRLLPNMPKTISRTVTRHLKKLGVKIYLNTTVQGQTADALLVHGKPIRSHTVVWTAGTSNSPFFAKNDFQLTKKGKVRVDHYLQAEPGIYVIGDNADTPYTGMAQTALHDGRFVAKNISRIAGKQDPRPYEAKKPIYVIPAGTHWAAALWGKLRIYGWAGWALRRTADFVAYNDYEPWRLATSRFMSEDDREESCPLCADNLA